jgi:hypothetical protein
VGTGTHVSTETVSLNIFFAVELNYFYRDSCKISLRENMRTNGTGTDSPNMIPVPAFKKFKFLPFFGAIFRFSLVSFHIFPLQLNSFFLRGIGELL